METTVENMENMEAVAEISETVTEAVESVCEAEEEAVKAPETVIEKTDSLLFVAPVGRLDTVVSNELKETLAAYAPGDTDIELDFANVEYISSAGLRLLVSLQKQAKAGGHTMVIRNTNAVVNEVFRVSGFNKAFTVL